MDIKISEGKLEFLIDTIFDGIGVDVNHLSHNFQVRMSYLEFLVGVTTRREMVAKYDFQYNYIIVFDNKFYDLVKPWVSYKVYDLIKEELIKRIFKVYTGKYKSIYKEEPKSIKFVDKEYNKV
jgi:hypothetical protein